MYPDAVYGPFMSDPLEQIKQNTNKFGLNPKLGTLCTLHVLQALNRGRQALCGLHVLRARGSVAEHFTPDDRPAKP